MIPTITSFTQKILQAYPDTIRIVMSVLDASHDNMYDTWTADIVNVILVTKYDTSFKLTPEQYYELFGTMTYIKLGKNNKSRVIDSKNVHIIGIDTKKTSFTTKDGKTIHYYPTTSKPDTFDRKYDDEEHKTFTRELINLSKNKHRVPKLSDLPDFDSD